MTKLYFKDYSLCLDYMPAYQINQYLSSILFYLANLKLHGLNVAIVG